MSIVEEWQKALHQKSCHDSGWWEKRYCWICNKLYAEGDKKVRDHDRHTKV